MPEVEPTVEGSTGLFLRSGNFDDLATKIEAMPYPLRCWNGILQAYKKMIDMNLAPKYQERA